MKNLLPFENVVVDSKKAISKQDILDTFKLIAETEVDAEWLETHLGITQQGLTAQQVLVVQMFKRAMVDGDKGDLDRILKHLAPKEGGGLNINIDNRQQTIEHGAQQLIERYSAMLDGSLVIEGQAEEYDFLE